MTDLQDSSVGAKIGNLRDSCLGFAGNLLLNAETPENLQIRTNSCEKWASKTLINFHSNKRKVIILSRPSANLCFFLSL